MDLATWLNGFGRAQFTSQKPTMSIYYELDGNFFSVVDFIGHICLYGHKCNQTSYCINIFYFF